MKRLLPALLAILLMLNSAMATILPAAGVDEDFKAWTGIECTPAVILCQSLSVYDNRGDQGGKKVDTLNYTGKDIPVIESWDGWAKIYYSDGTKTGWVRNDYLLMDPAWYVCDEDMQVYAYPDVMAPRVALLDEGTMLPILTEYEDGESIAGWVCVSLRGAAGWIRKTPADTADETWFKPEMLMELTGATLHYEGQRIFSNAPETVTALRQMLVSVNDTGAMTAGCPFTAKLVVYLDNGESVELLLATDSCCVYRVDGRDYQYARNLKTEPDSGVNNAVLYELFGIVDGVMLPAVG